MRRLIECVPNFSEGREPSRIRALVAAMSGIPGAWVLDRHSDADHNRTVITVAGEPEAVAEAAVRAVGRAAELIDLRESAGEDAGEHPRIGAADVVPFVPIEGVSMAECAETAHQVGRTIWERHGVPVYFYGAAALRAERRELEMVRRGQFEGLNEDLSRNAERAPDIGDPRLHSTAGAVAVGARKYLIAFNVMLNTPDVIIARAIARAVRASGGGLPAVKAMGVALRQRRRAQVSMNLTDFERTSMRQAFEAVSSEARKRGCGVESSEIVGLVPRAAISEGEPAALQLENFSRETILENRLNSALSARSANRILAGGSAHAAPTVS